MRALFCRSLTPATTFERPSELPAHAHLNTTAIYVQVSDPKRVEAIDRLMLPLKSD
jgi:hypothetical protein